MFDIGFSELLIILVVGLLVLGPKKLPEIARALGRGLAELRRASEDIRRSVFQEEESQTHPRFNRATANPPAPIRPADALRRPGAATSADAPPAPPDPAADPETAEDPGTAPATDKGAE